ncbi:MvdD family ATP-grasp ribosomal peptide maturase [Myxococcota bacterium]|nr:MvdD family ATP-grasp ribosomal peptide maturase [Myxococcota bacterium]
MSKPQVLLITHTKDNQSIPMVEEAIRRRGGEPIRLDTDRYPLEVKINTRYENSGWSQRLKTPNGDIDLTQLTAVWYRRFYAGHGLPETLGDLYDPSIQESRRTLWGSIASLSCFQLDPLSSVRRADHKEVQTRKAIELGLDIPRSLFTNDPDEARAFIESIDGPVITKMQHPFAVYRQGIENVVFTTRIQPDDLSALEGLRFCPMIFQEEIVKTLDVRVTIVGKQIFSAAVDAQTKAETQVDWRRDGVGLIRSWKPYTLPEDIPPKLLALQNFLGLNYGAIDFVVSPEGRHAFLEVNAVGEFFWLVDTPGLPIPDALADTLLGRVERIPAVV